MTDKELLITILHNQYMILQILSGMIAPRKKSEELYNMASKMREECKNCLKALEYD